MSDLAVLMCLMFAIFVTFFGSYWVNVAINNRGDDILSGVVNGVPATTKTRWLMLFANWVPYTMFFIAFLIVVGIGFMEAARVIERPRIEVIGYMCAILCFGGAAFWTIIGSFVFANMWSALRSGGPN